jgi:hypothetical protein
MKRLQTGCLVVGLKLEIFCHLMSVLDPGSRYTEWGECFRQIPSTSLMRIKS